MGGEADFLFRQRQPEFFPHRAAHPRITSGIRWPASLIQATKNNQIGAAKPSFNRAPDLQTRMQPVLRAHHPPAHQVIEKLRPGRRIELINHIGSPQQLRDEPGRGLAEVALPESRLLFPIGTRQGFRKGDEPGQEIGKVDRAPGCQLFKRGGRFREFQKPVPELLPGLTVLQRPRNAGEP